MSPPAPPQAHLPRKLPAQRKRFDWIDRSVGRMRTMFLAQPQRWKPIQVGALHWSFPAVRAAVDSDCPSRSLLWFVRPLDRPLQDRSASRRRSQHPFPFIRLDLHHSPAVGAIHPAKQTLIPGEFSGRWSDSRAHVDVLFQGRQKPGKCDAHRIEARRKRLTTK